MTRDPSFARMPSPDDRTAPAESIAGEVEPPMPPLDRPPEDLGFGSVVAGDSRRRLLNPDGSFNVARRGLGFWTSLSAYHALLRTSWPRFLALLALAYLAANVVFTFAYMACGPGAISGDPAATGGAFLHDFFFSVQTIATIGFGQATPVGVAANALVVAESLTGVLGFALGTGLLFARISRPTARIVFSRRAVIAPYRGRRGFMLRVANARRSEIIELEAKVILSLFEDVGGVRARRFHALALERQHVALFPLAWTIVHPIDEGSPLFGRSASDLLAAQAEFLVLLTGIEETFAQTVHARSSYRADEVVWGARFSDIFNREADDGDLTIDMGRLHGLEAAPLPRG